MKGVTSISGTKKIDHEPRIPFLQELLGAAAAIQ